METNSKKEKKKRGVSNLLYDFVKITGAIPTLIWLRPKVIRFGKREKLRGGVLISSNHISYIDPPLLLCVFWNRRVRFLATENLYDTPLKNFFFTHMHCIKVCKSNFSMSSFHAVTDNLKKNRAVLIFPEGQVNRGNDSLLSFKSGAVLMAHNAGAPILPVYIVKQDKWYRRKTVLIGESIDVRALVGERPSMSDLQRASEYIHDKEIELVHKYNEKYNKNKTIEKTEEKV